MKGLAARLFGYAISKLRNPPATPLKKERFLSAQADPFAPLNPRGKQERMGKKNVGLLPS
jgi:hypothetical protein